MEEWSYRPGLSAVVPGTVAGWLLGYARTRVEMRRSSRKQWAAWWVRMMWRDGEDWGGLYRDAVRQGKRPVKITLCKISALSMYSVTVDQ